MTPVEKAAAIYQQEACSGTFRTDLEAHLLHGFVFSRPDFFLMFRPVLRLADPKLIVNPWHRFPSGVCDCWHVFLMAGNLAAAWRMCPWPLPWISFERKNELRFIPADRIRDLSHLSHP